MLVTLDQNDRVMTVNQRFLDGTGHEPGDVVGHRFWDEFLGVGSRVFYQTQLAPVLQLDHRLDEVMVDLRTADGRRLPALMNVVREVDTRGQAAGTHIALMTVPDRRAFEDRLRQSRDEAEQAQRMADLARMRLELSAQANSALTGTMDVELALQQLTRTLTQQAADCCIIRVTDPEDPSAGYCAAAHTDPARQSDIESLAEALSTETGRTSQLSRLFRHGSAALFTDLGDSADDPHLRKLCAAVGLTSVIIVPVTMRNANVAVIAVGRGHQRASFTEDDLADVTDIASRTGIVIESLRRQAREHSNSIALQNALLTTPPKAERFEIVTRYLPATDDNEVGGDWYDALLLPDGEPLLVIGDVIGHDIHAAAAMGQLRGIIRTVAYTTSGSPSEILTQADHTARGLGVPVLATAILARLHTAPDGGTTMEWSNAGHPPPLLITSSEVQVLTADSDRLLGLPVELQQPRHDHTRSVHAGDTLIFYTDGLIERTDETLDRGIAMLVQRLLPSIGNSLDDLCDAILQGRRGDTRDDIALLAMRLGGLSSGWSGR
jgi:PAS domain S-box-containing protein